MQVCKRTTHVRNRSRRIYKATQTITARCLPRFILRLGGLASDPDAISDPGMLGHVNGTPPCRLEVNAPPFSFAPICSSVQRSAGWDTRTGNKAPSESRKHWHAELAKVVNVCRTPANVLGEACVVLVTNHVRSQFPSDCCACPWTRDTTARVGYPYFATSARSERSLINQFALARYFPEPR